jgi:hypothetical protein
MLILLEKFFNGTYLNCPKIKIAILKIIAMLYLVK